MEMQKTFTQIKNSLKEVQWRWIFGATFAVMASIQIIMFLIISIYVARNSATGNTLSFEEITQFSGTLGAQVGPIIFGLLTLIASIWMAIKVRVAPRTHGLVLGVVLLSTTVLMDAIFSPSVVLYEHIGNMIVIPIAWFGAYRGQVILKNREAVYRTSQALKGADRAGILKAIGEQLANPLVVLIALVDQDGEVDAASAWTSSPNRAIPASIPTHQTSPEPATVLKGKQLPLADTGIHSLLVLPLSQVDETLVVGSRSRDGFSRNAIQNYLTIAEQVALSLENLKLLEQAHQMGIVQERQRLAAEIHDSLTQGFISIVTHLEVAEAKLEQHPEALRTDLQGLLNQARQTARDNLTAARQMTWALRPDLQQVVPLAQSLEKLTDNWARANDIPVAFSASGEARQLHPDIETAVVRTVREALNNIQKYAQATQVSVTLTYMDTLVALDVQDNGRGCEPASLAQRSSGGGFGLKSIREQVEQLGGELTIEGGPGKGCTIAIALPIIE
jgi:signal transduction histidine kinase